MVSRIVDDKVIIVEAVSAGVVETTLEDFLARSADESGRPKVLVGRVATVDAPTIARSIDIARGFMGRPYDTVFSMDNSAFYCSELIYESFRLARNGAPLFELFPMTFKDPATQSMFPAWTDYYKDLGTAIPEGEPGLNPGGMSRSSNVQIMYAYGNPSGWHGTLEIKP